MALLAYGAGFGNEDLRRAALALLVLTVAKVFLMDMPELQGLYRTASFMGLGLSLVGLGFFYQRFVFFRQPAVAG